MKAALIILLSLLFLYFFIKILLSHIMFHYCFKRRSESQMKEKFEKQYLRFPKQKEYVDMVNNLDKTIWTIPFNNKCNLKAYYFKQAPNNKKIVILSHGWHGEPIHDSWYYGEFYFKHHDFDILMISHIGNSLSDGKYIGFSYLDGKNIKLWVDYINKTFNNEYQIFLHGVSMGASSILCATNYQLDNVLGIIVDCGFTSGYDEISYISKYKYHVPAFYTIPYIRHLVKRYAKYDILTPCIKEDNNSLIPALFIHGTADNFVPTYMSEENYQRYKGKKELLLIKNARHAWSLRTEQIKYESKVISFINDLTK